MPQKGAKVAREGEAAVFRTNLSLVASAATISKTQPVTGIVLVRCHHPSKCRMEMENLFNAECGRAVDSGELIVDGRAKHG